MSASLPSDPPAAPAPPPPGRVQVWLIDDGDPHAALRGLLGRALGVAPADLRIGAEPRGRPRLEEPHSALDFNLSHSGGLALVALASDRRVGVDLERMRPRPRWPAIAERWLSGSDREWIADLPEGERLAAFYDRWTALEAWVKLTGTGLARRGPRPEHAAIRPLAPAPGFAGSVAAEGSDWELDFWRAPALLA